MSSSAGEYLADVSALEAAGADTIWLEMGSLDAWVVLGALAAATQRVRLGCILPRGALRDAVHPRTGIATAQKVSRGRIVLAAPADELPYSATTGAKLFSVGAAHGAVVDGVIYQLDSPTEVPPRTDPRTDTYIEVWGDIGMPADREAWAATMSAYEAAGLTGVIVRWDTRLVDLLRNAQPDDRSDLWMSTG
jgi:hypothetical protein